ncbi:RraA family protein [Allopusillimonas ginsengisoli]|uniref:RraA family protein n=1 Tax=Allopusillimonas ginsengisoli TaxID=453575 RepID=UPI001020EF08|nr:RraA family protein [Allopusillimonas ginsengisoli]TEA79042.1 RraA family protein [Allopusillimonas ginsengisoli]
MTTQKTSDDSVLVALRGLSSSVLSDAMFGLGLDDTTLDPSIRLLAGETILGRAITIGRIPMPPNATQESLDASMTLAIQEVIDSAGKDSILVTAVQGIASHANWGGNQALRASKVGILGIVTDGAIRDLNEMQGYGMTVFAKCTSPRAGQHRFATTVKNGPVVCGGVLIKPGDIIAGDADGVLLIPEHAAEEIALKARLLIESEEKMQTYMKGGGSLTDAVKRFKIR